MGNRAGWQSATSFTNAVKGTASSNPTDITAGPDGNLWFTEFNAGRVAKITTAGVVTEFSAGITAGANPYDITAGPDGNLWFTEWVFNKIGKITTAGTITLYTLPTSVRESISSFKVDSSNAARTFCITGATGSSRTEISSQPGFTPTSAAAEPGSTDVTIA